MRVFLVRHGESVSNADPKVSLPDEQGDRLTERGREQAHAAGRALRQAGADELISSPMGRAMQTAEILSEQSGLPVTVNERIHELRESRDYGTLSPEEQKLRRWSVWMAEHGDDPDYSWNGGETFNQVLARVRGFQEELAAGDPSRVVVAVTHGIFSRFFFVWSLFGNRFGSADVSRLWNLRTANGALSSFELGERHHPADPEIEGWVCRSWMQQPSDLR